MKKEHHRFQDQIYQEEKMKLKDPKVQLVSKSENLIIYYPLNYINHMASSDNIRQLIQHL